MCAQLESVPALLCNVRQGCICPNGGKPVDGLIYIDPCCKVHYAELRLSVRSEDPNQLLAWPLAVERGKKRRIAYPKMTVARR